MRNTITLNGVESSTIPGLLIQELAPISKPLMRTEVETIDGRDGDITTDLGFSAYDKQISIGLFADYDINQIIAYFNSKGTVIFSNEPEKFYNYEIVDQIDFERLVRYRTATVTMHCQPFKYSTTEGADILSTNSNFATLNQSLNTDTSFYTYSSNVQDDVTATRSSGTGGKFFAVFSVPVVQGVTYYFSGNVSKNVSMYGYTNQLRGTSAGISGKGFNGYFTYTATFTGTMVLGFYSSATTELFIRNFKISNQSAGTVSGEGTNIVLENSAEAPFSRFDLKGNTEQTIYSGKNLLALEGTASEKGLTISRDTTTGALTFGGTTTGTWPWINSGGTSMPAGTYTFSIDHALPYQLVLRFYESGSSYPKSATIQAGSTQATVTTTYTTIYTAMLYGITSSDTVVSSTTIYPQLELGSSATSFEPYVGGTSPNPDYPQAVQTVTGENVVRIVGKNILSVAAQNSSGITTTYDTTTGQIHISGTPTTQWVGITRYVPFNIPSGTTLTVSTSRATGSLDGFSSVTVRVRNASNANTDDITIGESSQETTKTTQNDNDRLQIWLNFGTNYASKTIDTTFTVQLEKGSAATPFEPYQEQNYEINLGKNLADVTTLNNGNILADGTITDSTDYKNTELLPITPSKQYVATAKSVSGIDSTIRLAFYDAAGTFISRPVSANPAIATAPSNAHYARLAFREEVSNVQLELGSTATSYAPYFTPIELCKLGDYQDYIYKSVDKWYVHKAIGKYQATGSEAWVRSGNTSATCFVAAIGSTLGNYIQIPTDGEIKSLARCDSFHWRKTTLGQDRGSFDLYNGTTYNESWALSFDITKIPDITAAKAWITANRPTLYAPILTPTDTEITNEALIEQLEAVSQAHAYRERTHINATAATGNVPHIIAAEVATDPSGTITNSGNIYSKPKLTIFGSGSVGVYLNGVQMFQIALGTNDYITIDTAIMEAYQDNLQTLKNRSVTGDYNNFKLPVGESEISFSGSVTMCVVENYSRWL